MSEIRLELSSKDKENINKLKEKYGFKKRKTCLDFLLPYSHNTMLSSCGGIMKLKKTPRMNFIIDESKVPIKSFCVDNSLRNLSNSNNPVK